MIKNILFYVLIFSFTRIFAQISFEASVSKNSLGINERLRIVFEMNENGDNFTPPNFKDFSIIGGPNQSVSNSWINGKRSFSKKITYFLSPKSKGNITIGQAIVKINGEIYKTSPLKIEITEAVETSLGENNPNYIVENNIHLVAELSKENPYLNESFTVVYKLYYSDEIGISSVNELDKPKFPDFWSHTIKIPRLEVKQGVYKGSSYRYVTWNKTVLYPQKIGKLDLDPLTLNVSVDVPTNRADFFGNRVYQQVPKVITAGKRSVNVRELPEKDKPDKFNGAVGDFDLEVFLNKTELKASESLQAKIKVKGRGNLKLFNLPKLSVPNSLEVYDPEHKQSIKTDLKGMQGSIEDIYTIVPQNKGKFPIPSISFSYFNPDTEKYISLNSSENIIDVLDSPNNDLNISSNTNFLVRKNPLIFDMPFSFIRLKSNFISVNEIKFWETKKFYFVLIFPFLLLILFGIITWIYRKRGLNKSDNRSKLANILARRYLSSAKKRIGDKDLFYDSLERALHNYLKAKLNIETNEFNKEKISELLVIKSIDKLSTENFVKLLEDCELARYSPSTLVRMKEDFENAIKTIALIDKQL